MSVVDYYERGWNLSRNFSFSFNIQIRNRKNYKGSCDFPNDSDNNRNVGHITVFQVLYLFSMSFTTFALGSCYT